MNITWHICLQMREWGEKTMIYLKAKLHYEILCLSVCLSIGRSVCLCRWLVGKQLVFPSVIRAFGLNLLVKYVWKLADIYKSWILRGKKHPFQSVGWLVGPDELSVPEWISGIFNRNWQIKQRYDIKYHKPPSPPVPRWLVGWLVGRCKFRLELPDNYLVQISKYTYIGYDI